VLGFLSIVFFVLLQLFNKPFTTFHVRFIKIISVNKIKNAFVNFCKRYKRLYHLCLLEAGSFRLDARAIHIFVTML